MSDDKAASPAPGILPTEPHEYEYCDRLVREYVNAMNSLRQAEALANAALGRLRQFGELVAARHGYPGGEWFLYDKRQVMDRDTALQHGVIPGAFSQRPEGDEPPARPMPLPPETKQ